jgi:hypothetical protein
MDILDILEALEWVFSKIEEGIKLTKKLQASDGRVTSAIID